MVGGLGMAAMEGSLGGGAAAKECCKGVAFKQGRLGLGMKTRRLGWEARRAQGISRRECHREGTPPVVPLAPIQQPPCLLQPPAP